MSWLSKVFDRVEISSLLSQHLTTFYHYEKKTFHNKTEIPKADKFVFIGVPILLTICLVLAGLRFTKDYVDIILTCLSIFTGLLFTLLTMILGLVQENTKIEIDKIPASSQKKTKARIDLTQHLFINIGFSIVLSIFALISVLLTQFYPKNIIEILSPLKFYSVLKQFYLYTTNGIAFFLLFQFLLTLLMIVKRFAVLFINQVSTES